MPLIKIATPFNVEIDFEIAEFQKRFLAYLIDLTIILLYLVSIVYLLFGGLSIRNYADTFIHIVAMIPMLLYTFMAELLLNGQTIGKKILRIRVISIDGNQPTMGQYTLRWFLRFYEWGFIIMLLFWWQNATFGILILIAGGITSIIVMAVNSKSQRLGDIAAGTAVINTKSKITVDDTIFMNVSHDNYKVMFPEVLKLSDRDINTIKTVLAKSEKNKNYEICNRVANKVQSVLKVSSDLYANEFLEKLLEDYNYLATKE